MGEVTQFRGVPDGAGRVSADLAMARARYRAGKWREAWELLSALPDLDAADLEFRGTVAFLIGEPRAYFEDVAAAFGAYEDPARQARCAAWLAIMHFLRGETGHSSGWLATARRITEEHGECAASAYLEVTAILEDRSPGRDNALAIAREMNQIARTHDDTDAIALTGQTLGELLIRTGQAEAGCSLMDEAMVAAASGRLSGPLVEILAYLAVFEGCRLLADVTRAREWTSAMGRLESRSPDLEAFTGVLRLRRAEVAYVNGDWSAALAGLADVTEPLLQGEVWLLRGHILRHQGKTDAAGRAYEQAAAFGADVAVGTALLHRDRGQGDVASALIRRALAPRKDRCERAAMLPAAITVHLDDPTPELRTEVATLVAELSATAEALGSPLLQARAAYASGLLATAEGFAQRAVEELDRASTGFAELRIPAELWASKMASARAHRALGDVVLARIETEQADRLADQLGLARPLNHEVAGESGTEASLLSPRELEVLALVASGVTNREIAGQLTLSPRTVDRHVSNILTKIGAPSRTAAAAFAAERGLL